MNASLLPSIVIGGLTVLLAEKLRSRRKINNETARKIIHIAHALTVSTWPFFVSYLFIICVEIVFIFVVVLSRKQGWLSELRNVQRASWGEIFFGLGVILAAALRPSSTAFLIAMLHLGMVDSLATLVGQRLKSRAYNIFGQRKTVAGTAAAAISSIGVIAGLAVFGNTVFTVSSYVLSLLIFPLVTTFAENFSPYGSDNLTIPLAVLGLCGLFGL